MTKQDFLRDLEQALEGQIPSQKVQENLRYYNNYIEEQKRTGLTEAEVLEQLGDARLIAQSILDAAGATEGGSGYSYESGGSAYGSGGAYRPFGEDSPYGGNGQPDSWIAKIDLSKWYWKLAVGVIVILVAALVLSILFGIIKLLFYIAIPVIAVVAIVALIEYFKDMR